MKIDPKRGYPPRSPPERVHCAARRSVTTQRIMDRDEPLSWLKVVVSRSGRWAVFAGPADPERRGGPAPRRLPPPRPPPPPPAAGGKTDRPTPPSRPPPGAARPRGAPGR